MTDLERRIQLALRSVHSAEVERKRPDLAALRARLRRGVERRRVFVGMRAVVFVAAVVAAIVVVPGLRLGSDREHPVDRTATDVTPSPTPSAFFVIIDSHARCRQGVPFKPTYLPPNYTSELHDGPGGQDGESVSEQSVRAIGHYRSSDYSVGQRGSVVAEYIDVFRRGDSHLLPPDSRGIGVLGRAGKIGLIHEGFSVEFTYKNCSYSLIPSGLDLQQLRLFAEGLVPKAKNYRQDVGRGFAVWPGTTGEDVRRFCNNGRSFGSALATSVVFADRVLGWEKTEVKVDRRGRDAAVHLARARVHDRRSRLLINLSLVARKCWFITGVNRKARFSPVGVAVRDRRVGLGFETIGASSIELKVRFGDMAISQTTTEGDAELALPAKPEGSGSVIILYRNSAGEVISVKGFMIYPGLVAG